MVQKHGEAFIFQVKGRTEKAIAVNLPRPFRRKKRNLEVFLSNAVEDAAGAQTLETVRVSKTVSHQDKGREKDQTHQDPEQDPGGEANTIASEHFEPSFPETGKRSKGLTQPTKF